MAGRLAWKWRHFESHMTFYTFVLWQFNEAWFTQFAHYQAGTTEMQCYTRTLTHLSNRSTAWLGTTWLTTATKHWEFVWAWTYWANIKVTSNSLWNTNCKKPLLVAWEAKYCITTSETEMSTAKGKPLAVRALWPPGRSGSKGSSRRARPAPAQHKAPVLTAPALSPCSSLSSAHTFPSSSSPRAIGLGSDVSHAAQPHSPFTQPLEMR